MTPDGFKKRTKAFALRIIRLVNSLPKSQITSVIGGQLLRCGTSVGANYRAACRARSSADFIAKMGVCEEECDETVYRMEILIESGLVGERRMSNLLGEADEILSMVVASIKTSRRVSSIRNPKSAIRNEKGPIPC